MKYLLPMIMLAMTTLTTNAQGAYNKAAKQNSLPLVNEWLEEVSDEEYHNIHQ